MRGKTSCLSETEETHMGTDTKFCEKRGHIYLLTTGPIQPSVALQTNRGSKRDDA